MKKIRFAAYYIISLSIYSANAQPRDSDPYAKFMQQLPEKLAAHNILPSSNQRQRRVMIDGKVYYDFEFSNGKTRFLYDPSNPGQLSAITISDEAFASSRVTTDIRAEDFPSFKKWKAFKVLAGDREPSPPESVYYDKYDRANGTIEFMGRVYTYKDLGGVGISEVGLMIEKSNEARKSFEKGGWAREYNKQIYLALTEINRALNNPKLSPKHARELAAKRIELERRLQTRHGDVIAIQNAIRNYRADYDKQRPLDERMSAEGEIRLKQAQIYEAQQNAAAERYEEGRNDAYQFQGRDLKASINAALKGIKEATHFFYESQHAGILTDTLSREILDYPVKDPTKLPVRPSNYVSGVGYPQESLDNYNDSLENRKLKSFLNPKNLIKNFSQLDLSNVPMTTLQSGEKIVDISYVYDISEKIRRGTSVSQNEKDLMTALLVNFENPKDFERLFSLIYGYEMRTKFENNLHRSVVDYTKGLSIEMLRLFVISKINNSGTVFKKASIFSREDQEDELIRNYEKIKKASRSELEELLKGALIFRNVNRVPEEVIVPLVFLKLVEGSNDEVAKSVLKMPHNFSETSAKDVAEYVSRLNYLITLQQQNYQAFEQRKVDNRSFSEWYDASLPDITSRFMKDVFKVAFPYDFAPRVRIENSALRNLKLPKYFEQVITFERETYPSLTFEAGDKAQAKFLMKNISDKFSSSSSANSCMKYYRR